MISAKRPRTCRNFAAESDLFDVLPDDLLIHLLCRLASSASSPSDLLNLLLTCKRLNRLVLHPLVLSKAGPKAFAVRMEKWCDSAHRFLKRCVDAGNSEASYTLGMIRFYCLRNRGSGASLMAKAAIKSHAPALYSLAVIQFNGSGGSKSDKDLQAGVALCARAAFLGHVDALRELGHCLQDGYGVRRNSDEGRRLLIQANARELAAVLLSSSRVRQQRHHQFGNLPDLTATRCSLLSDFGCDFPATEPHPVNLFLREWFESERGVAARVGLRLCSHGGCGRPETRPHEFRRCSICGTVNYCSRGCQAQDWKVRHKEECTAVQRWQDAEVDNAGGGIFNAVEEVEDANVVGTV
ncbi:F-box protein At1g67340-like [Cucurbita pepo subsp. pepo]|uniref:F-box protein At1g67340-like n=2 Tax=Cucurbita pepo subsp. pepo TaxID=3664 RepID=UPI000C9D7DC8|nr:F-box protein At1g67340-like [Cucurbita pepo subsp. pepo]